MVEVFIKEGPYSYEVQALVKNFYPQHHIIRREPEQFGQILQDPAGETAEQIRIELEETEIGISLLENGIPIFEKKSAVAAGKTYKNQLKAELYRILSKRTGRQLDWGTLTGVRPTKVLMALIEEGHTFGEINARMQEDYLCAEEKIRLGYQIAKKEMELLTQIDYRNGYSIYIGIPFCPTTCLYCSFTSFSAEKFASRIDAYLEALFREIDFAGSCISDKKLTTVYIGGGTPTTLNEEQLERLLKKVTGTFDFSQVCEFTVEAGRPDSITFEKLCLLKTYGVDRISINPQTMKEQTLVKIGRSHTVLQVKEAFLLARKAGHDNINMDLIAGLPGETLQDMKDTLEQIKELNPDSITVHSLVTKRAARLNQEKEKLILQNVDEMTDQAAEFAFANGYQPYYMYRQKNAQGSGTGANQENIGYARPQKEGIYNILIMEEKHTILALGAGATSKFVFQDENRMERVENVKSLLDYIERIDEMVERKAAFLRKEGLHE